MEIRNGLLYGETHEWVKNEDGVVRIGISDFAQKELGEIVFVDLPEVGDEINKGDELSEIESVKAVSEVYSPISGTIEKINEELLDNPALINENAFENWLVEVRLSNESELEELLSPEQYKDLIEK